MSEVLETAIATTRIYSVRRRPFTYLHPWLADVSWDGDRWRAFVAPGFVNDEPALVAMSAADIAKQKLPAVDGMVGLWDRPFIPLQDLRDVVGSGEAIPAFFRELGVKAPESITVDAGGNLAIDETARQAGDDLPERSLRAMDFFLAVARASYRASLSIVDGTGNSGQVVDMGVTFDSSVLDQRGSQARLMQAAKFEPVREPTFADRFLGNYEDDGEDRARISTVFFLSPPGVTSGEVGPDWEPFVEYTDFGCWNLCHDAPNETPPRSPQPIRLFTGLVGGIGDDIANRTLAFLNDQAALVTSAVNATNNRGYFWSV